MQGAAWPFFVILALVLLASYLAIRRGWFAPGITAAVSVITSVVLMTLVALAQNNSFLQAVIVGILVGGIFSGATLALAWYFQAQQGYADTDSYAEEDYAPDETA